MDSRVLDDFIFRAQTESFKDLGVLEERKPEFRVSSLPFCPLLHVSEHLNYLHDPDTSVDYNTFFYTNIGTTLHSLWNSLLKNGASSEYVGLWQCGRVLEEKDDQHFRQVSRCTKTSEICSFEQLRVGICPHGHNNCKKFFHYKEIEVLWRGLSGHVDGLLRLNGKLYLVDFKTTSNWLFDYPKQALKSDFYPSKKYCHQIESYCVLLKLLFDIKVDYVAIVYLGREKPSSKNSKNHMVFCRKVEPKWFVARQKLLERQTANFKLADRTIQSKTVKRRKELLDAMWQSRPCQKPEDYEKQMACRFFGNEVCPYHADKTCASGKIKKTLLDGLNVERKNKG